MRQIEIVEVGPRDGLQNTDTMLDTATKVSLIERMLDAGAHRIEATSFVHPKHVPQMADAEDVMAAVPRDRGASYIGLVLNDRGLDRALQAQVDEVNVVVVATETFSRRNQGVGVDDMLASWERIAARAVTAGGPGQRHPVAPVWGPLLGGGPAAAAGSSGGGDRSARP